MHPFPTAHDAALTATATATATAPLPIDVAAHAARLAACGAEFSRAGWVPAGSGNFSMRVGPRHVLITRSGVDKGTLEAHDFLIVDTGQPLPPAASAEAPLHLALYLQQAAIGCVLHVHARSAAVLSRRCLARGETRLVLEGWELQKAIAGQHTHEAQLHVPVFANAQDTVVLAGQIATALPASPEARGYLLAGHGLYAWGATLAEARRHVIAFDALFQCQLDLERA